LGITGKHQTWNLIIISDYTWFFLSVSLSLCVCVSLSHTCMCSRTHTHTYTHTHLHMHIHIHTYNTHACSIVAFKQLWYCMYPLSWILKNISLTCNILKCSMYMLKAILVQIPSTMLKPIKIFLTHFLWKAIKLHCPLQPFLELAMESSHVCLFLTPLLLPLIICMVPLEKKSTFPGLAQLVHIIGKPCS